MSFSIYQSLRPSTSVDHTAACAFTQPGAEELVICRVNVLEVWRPSPIQNQMQLAMQFDLPGEVNSLQKFPISLDAFTLEEQQQWKHRLPERGLDCLVLAFDEAKISLVCFDPTKPRVLKTCALFNFEDSARGSELRATKVGLLPCPPSQFGSRAFALVDPQYRCIAMVVYSSFVAVIPIRQILLEEEDDAKQELIRVLAGSDDEGSSSEEEDDDDGDEEQDRAEGMDEEQQLALQRLRTNRPVSFGGRVLKKSSALKRECGNDHPMFGTPHLLPLSAFEVGQHTAISACFAENSFTPTLLVLYTDPIRTWAPRVHVYANTCNVCAISLCAENPLAATKAWQATNLPHDALNLIPVKSGGALVVCTNALVYINSVPRERVTMAVNAFANVSCLGTRSNPIYNTKGGDATGEEEDDLDTSFAFASTSAVVWITKQTLLCVLARGELLQVCLNAGQGNLMRMTCKLVGAVGGTVFTCAALLPVKQLLFFGSRSTDGVFLTYAQEEQVVLPTENKRVKLEDEVSYVPLDEDFVPQDADAEVDEQSLTLLLEIVDYLPVLGPITDMDFADALPTNPFNLERARQEDQQIIARAEREYAELMAIHRSNQANQARERGELLVRENRRKREQEPIRRDVDLVTVGSKTRVDPKCFAYSCGYRVNIRQTLSLLECSMLFALNAHTLVVSGSNKTRVFSLSLTADAAGQVVEQKQHSLCNPNQATLFTSTLRGSIKGVVQVLPQELRLFASKGLLKQRFALNKHQHIVQVVFEANVLFLVLANASLKAFQITEDFQFKPVDEFATNVASLACFVCPTTGKLTAMCVLNGDGGKESGTLEIYEDFKLVFRGDHPLPLSPTCVSNALGQNIAPLTDADKAHRAGVLLNCPVVDLLASRVGTETNFKILLLAALGDGELCVFERWGDRGERWYRVNHNLITRGLRGRQSRPRKYAQPSKAFRGPVLHSFVLDNSRRVFFGGHRPCMIFCHLGRVSAVPLAGSVSCLLPPPLVPVAAAVKSTASAPGGAAAAVVATAILEEEVACLVPGPNDIYRARGAIHAFCCVDSLLVFALRAPEPAIKPVEPLKSTALWFCTSALSGAQDFTGGIPASVHQVPHPETSWNCTHVVYLPHASRGSKVEQALGLHAPTFALISSRDETLTTATEGGNGNGDEEEEDIPQLSEFGGEPDVVVLRQSLDIARSPDLAMTCATFTFEPDERVVSIMTTNLDLPAGSELYQAMLAEKHPRPQYQGVIVVGTGSIHARGEDGSSKGRILVFQLDHVSTDDHQWLERNRHAEGRPSTRPMLRVIASVELRGPVSALASLDGKILAATGNMPCSVKLLEISGRNEGLIPIGFYDAPTCVVSMNVIREQFVLLGDMNKSIQFIRWKDRQFYCLGKSFDNVRAFASEFVVDGNRLLLTAADEEANFRVWHYDPEGQFLQVRGEMNIGVRVGKMKSKRMPPLPPKQAEEQQDGTAQTAQAHALPKDQAKWCLIMGTLAGGLSSLVPLEEKVFRRLDLLQQAMVASALIPRNAGLHPLQCSQPRVPKRPSHSKTLRNATATIVDGRILHKFVDLEKITQIKLAMSIGSTVESILDTLLEISLVSVW